jgi:CAAX protease family protein
MPLDFRERRIAVGVGKVLAFLVVTQVLLQVVVFTALRAVSARYWSQYDGRGLNEPWFLSSSIAILGVVLFVTFVFLKYVDRRDWSYVRFRSCRSVRFFGVGLVSSFAAVVLFLAIAINSDVLQLSLSVGAPWQIALYLFLAFVGGGALVVQEELLLRGYALRTLEMTFNRSVGVVATALLFGLFHLGRAQVSVPAVLNIFLMGCLLALVCVRTGSLWSAIGLHFGWNSSLYLFDFPVSGAAYPNPLFALEYKRHSWIGGSAFGPEDSVVVTALMGLLLAGVLMWRSRGGPQKDGGDVVGGA